MDGSHSQSNLRRLLQFRLRTLAILLILCCLLAAWLSGRLRRARKQQQAIQVVEGLGGDVAYDYQFDERGDAQPDGDAADQSLLVGRLGLDFFADPWAVSFGGSVFVPASGLDLGYSALRDVSDDDLRVLSALGTLRKLDLGHTRVTDEGLKHLQSLKYLEELDLSGTETSGAGLCHIAEAEQLKHLDLGSTAIHGSWFQQLARFSKLEKLILRHSLVIDADLKRLSVLPNLSYLDLTGTAVTDTGMGYLEDMKQLRTLQLEYNLVTEPGAAQLLSKLPNLYIKLRTVESLTP